MTDFDSELDEELKGNFRDRLDSAASLLKSSESHVRVVSHYDPDGITSAAILAKTLLRLNKKFHVSMPMGYNKELFQKFKKEKNPLIIFSDLGSTHIDIIEKLKTKAVILDHHKPIRESESENVVQLNPHFFGIDGAREASGSTVSFLFARCVDKKNWDLSPLSLAGSIGDKQSIGGFRGPNKTISGIAIEQGFIKVGRALALDDGPVVESLTTSIEPYFKGISGRKDKAEAFLAKAGIDNGQDIKELGEGERRTLTSMLSLSLLRQDVVPEFIRELVEDKYIDPKTDMELSLLVSYLNACGRNGKAAVGLSLCLGEKSALEEAKALRTSYRKEVMDGLLKIEKDGSFSKDNIQFFYTERSKLAGVFAGLSMQYIFGQGKPTFCLATSGKETKLSARGTSVLVARGLDLGAGCRIAGEEVKGVGGGHNIASGATVPKGKEEKFLELVDKIVGEQLRGKEQSNG